MFGPTMASSSAADPSVKALQPFLQRATEMQTADPKIAYHTRVFVMESGLAISEKSPAMIELLGTLMEQLERTKPTVQFISPQEDAAHCENFALTIFAKADALDRKISGIGSGASTKAFVSKTAKMFYVASLFFEILRQFGEMDEDIESKQKYAAWRAGDLSSCVREGRVPSAPPSTQKNGHVDYLDGLNGVEAQNQIENDNANGLSPGLTASSPNGMQPPPPAAYTPPSAPHPPAVSPPGAPHEVVVQSSASPVGSIRHTSNYSPQTVPPSPPKNLPPVHYGNGIGIANVAEAQKFAKFAVSALGFEDVPTAIDNLQRALALLTGRLEA